MTSVMRDHEPAVGARHPRPSWDAAERAGKGAASQRSRIEDYVRRRGIEGATSVEICAALEMGAQSVSARLQELRGDRRDGWWPVRLRYAEIDGKRLRRAFHGGTPAYVHVHVAAVIEGEQMRLSL